jgi:hypothetical protein
MHASGKAARRSRTAEDEAFDQLVDWLQHRRARNARRQDVGARASGAVPTQIEDDDEEGVGTGLEPRSRIVAVEESDAGPYRAHRRVPEPEPEPEPEPAMRKRPGLTLELEQPELASPATGELKFYTMSFNMECGDPTQWKDCSFLPTDCHVYVIGLQEAGGENITEVPPSPRPPPGAKKKPGTEETLYNMIETYLHTHCGERPPPALPSCLRVALSCRSRARLSRRADAARARAGETGCVRLRHDDTSGSGGVLQAPAVAGRGDQSLKKPKFTSMGVFVREDLTPRVQLQASCAHSFGKTEGSKGAVAMVLRCDGTTIAFVNCHLTAGKGKAGSSTKRVGQYVACTRATPRSAPASAHWQQRGASVWLSGCPFVHCGSRTDAL